MHHTLCCDFCLPHEDTVFVYHYCAMISFNINSTATFITNRPTNYLQTLNDACFILIPDMFRLVLLPPPGHYSSNIKSLIISKR
jgi:hypothetical protein